ncbi:DoxX family protein [Agrococcus terreus]|uniref:Membrane protein n=1 Tax=Agrococcus terreus TaxID=574649 RepID=A0ABQ2KLT8_9MICO|nr:DoxX family membrane protein [Agrococcus terreus]GGN85741.1 membrane protein [Agrococcus terreus]
MAAPGGAAAPRSRAAGAARTAVRVLLGAFLLLAGIGHLTFAREEFQAQVPPWLPLDPDVVVVASGIVELALGLALLLAPRRVRPIVGIVVAAFFVAILPGNIAQWAEGRDGFGLDSDAARAIRLLFQPLLVVVALWSTGGWAAIRRRLRDRRR